MKNALMPVFDRIILLRITALLCLALTTPAGANVPGGGTTGPNVTLTNGSSTAVLANGIVTATVTKTSATVTSMLYKGFQVVSSLSGSSSIYFSMDGGTTYQNPNNCVFTIVTQTPDMVDVSCKHFYASGDPHVLDIDIHYVLRRGASGLYVYAVLTHPTTYAGAVSPATTMGEWRMVWWVPQDPKNTNNYLLENIYVDALRNGPAPSFYDFTQSTVTSIQEISLINTGPQAGTYFSKYEFAADYTDIGCWGHASDVNKIGAWVVLGSDEYLNDGPNMQDLTVAQGYSLLHFGRDHYGGSTTTLAAGETWSKTFGPYLLYLNSAADGPACWADAKAQVTAETSAWPYSWLTTAADYPTAAQRGAVTGQFLVSDPLKPAQTGAGAWVGVSQPDPGGNWQYESKRYQYWAKAGADGSFSIPNIRPGTYTLSAYVTGEVGEYTGTATVSPGNTTSLGNVVWSVVHPGKSIAWEIGIPDRSAAEFRHGSTDYFQGYLYKTFVTDLPNPLEYTVGTSNWATDWNYAHSALTNTDGTITGWKWRIHFNLPALPTSGNATLTIASAGSQSAHMYLYVNNESHLFQDIGSPPNTGGNALLRQGVHAKYGVQYVTIPISNLVAGANTITLLEASTSGSGNHVMYDYLNLEMPYVAVSGSASLQGWVGTGTMPALTCTLTPTGTTGGSVITQVVTPASDGSFALSNVPGGTYTLGVKGSRWLKKDVSVNTTGGSVSGLSVPLVAGDVNGDNVINGADISAVAAAFRAHAGDANWNPNCDLNGDGVVNGADISIASANFRKTGDP